MFDRDQPKLPAFRPEKAFDPTIIESTEENLIKIISKKCVEDAIKLYERICLENKTVSKQTQVNLFFILNNLIKIYALLLIKFYFLA